MTNLIAKVMNSTANSFAKVTNSSQNHYGIAIVGIFSQSYAVANTIIIFWQSLELLPQPNHSLFQNLDWWVHLQ